MTTQTINDSSMMLNLFAHHRDREKFYAHEALEKALQLQRASRILLLTLAGRWS